MECTDGCRQQRRPCHCLRDKTNITGEGVQKIVELQDASVGLYRYVPQHLDPEKTIGEVYILRKNNFESETDEFTIPFAKIRCPRCLKLIEKSGKLFTDVSTVKPQDIAGVCEHCWKPLLKSQKHDQIAKKGVKVSAEAAAAAEALQAQILEATEVEESERRKSKDLEQIPISPSALGIQTQTIPKTLEAKEREAQVKTKESKHKVDGDALKVKDEKTDEDKQKAEEDEIKAKEGKQKADDHELKAKEGKPKTKDEKLKGTEGKQKPDEYGLKRKEGKPKADEHELKAKEDKQKAKEGRLKGKEKTHEDGLKAKDGKQKADQDGLKAKEGNQKADEDGLKAKEGKKKADQEDGLKAKEGNQKADEDGLKAKEGKKKADQEDGLKAKEGKQKADQEDGLKAKVGKQKAKDESLKEKEGKEKVNEDGVKEKEDKIKESKLKVSEGKAKDEKTKGGKLNSYEDEPKANEGNLQTKEGKQEANEDEVKEKEDKINKSKLKVSEGKAKDEITKGGKLKATEEIPKDKSKITVEEKSKEEKPKKNEDKLEADEIKTKEEKQKDKPPKDTASTEQLKAQIALEKLKKEKEKQEAEDRKKQLERENKIKEVAERRAREQELNRERANEMMSPPLRLLPSSTDSEDDAMRIRGRPAIKAPKINDIIIGDKIRKIKQIYKSEEVDLDKAQKFETSGKAVIMESGRLKKEQILDSKRSKKGPVAESEINEKGQVVGTKIDKKGPIAEPEIHEKGQVDGTKTDKKGPVAEPEIHEKGQVVASKISKKGPAVETERHGENTIVAPKATDRVPYTGSAKHNKTSKLSGQGAEMFGATKFTVSSEIQKNKPDNGIMRFALSDRTFIDKGWTMLPLEKVVRKTNVYRMRPAKPELDWFQRNKNKMLEYDSGERLADIEESGRGRLYYRSGALALDYYDAEETNAGQRYVVYSTGTADERGRARPRTVLATFDYLGNGIVFDHKGKIRLKYNQTEGVVLDRGIGPVSHWMWHSLNEPPALQQVMIDTQLSHLEPAIARLAPDHHPRQDDEAMLAIEFDNFMKEKAMKSSQTFKPFQIKMKALKINENFSLRVVDQATVHLLFKDGTTNVKINLGMLLDHKEIVDTDTSEIGEVANKMEKLPACSASIAELQRSVALARAAERRQALHARRLAGLLPVGSDAAIHALSRPPRTPLLTCSVTSPKRPKRCPCDLYDLC